MGRKWIGLLAVVTLLMSCSQGEKKAAFERQEAEKALVTTLDNGLELVLIENHGNPVIASFVVVKTGLRNETVANNGVSHFLEHLLFNGTKTRTQKQLYDEMDFLGAYNNAFTREDFTGYIILAPKDNFEKALDIQTDMLFNSVFPQEKLEKERGIVIEEIGKDRDRPGNQADVFFASKMYEGTPYSRPILGSETSISHMTRDQVLDYYHNYYVPNNMIAMIIGDFETQNMLELFRKAFKPHPARDLPSPKGLKLTSLAEGTQSYTKPVQTGRKYLRLGVQAPLWTDPEFHSFIILNQLLSDRLTSKLVKETGLAFDVSSSYDFYQDLSVLRISASVPLDGDEEEVIATVLDELENISYQSLSLAEVQRVRVSMKVEEVRMAERPHYYGMMKGQELALGGYGFLRHYLENLDLVTPASIRRAAKKFFPTKDIPYMAVWVKPGEKGGVEEVEERGQTIKKVLDNGLTVIVDENADSRVFALHILVRDRSLNEPDGKMGIADCLHRMLRKGTENRSEEEISEAIGRLGASLKLVDNPWIPFDNYYTSPQFSFIRFETIDEYWQAGLELVADLVQHPTFPGVKLAEVKREMFNLIQSGEERASQRAKVLFYENLFGDHYLGKRVLGTEEMVESITEADLKTFHRRYFDPANLILTVVSNIPAPEVMERVEASFGPMITGEFVEKPHPRPSPVYQQITQKMGKGQSYLKIGFLIDGVDARDRAPLEVMNAVLSARMAFELRERKGWAYSLGTTVNFADDFGYLIASMGTRPQNLTAAREGIIAEIRRMKSEPPGTQEIERIKNKLLGRFSMRRLSRINQAYFMGIDEIQGLGYDYSKRYTDYLQGVTPEGVRQAAQETLQTNQLVVVTVK